MVDDASTDRSAELAEQFVSDDRFCLIRREANGGAAAAQNTGVLAASGGWIALLGSDDAWMPDKLEKQIALISENPGAALVFSNGIEFDESGDLGPFYRDRRRFPDGHILDRLLDRNCFWASSVMVRRRDLVDVGLFREDLAVGEDYLAWALILARGGRAAGVWEPLVRYRKRGTSLSNRREQAYRDLERVHRRLLDAGLSERHRAIVESSLARNRSDRRLCAARIAVKSSKAQAARELFRAWLCLPGRVKPLLWTLALLTPWGSRAVGRQLARKW